MELSIIIPAVNEEKRLPGTLKSIRNKLKDLTYEIIVVSNGSTDGTIPILKNLKKKYKNLKYLDFTWKAKGGAILEGFKVAKGKYIGFIDADDAFDLIKIKKEIRNLGKFDGFIASKWKNQKMATVNEPFLRKILSRGWNLLARILCDITFTDTQGGAKFFKKKAIATIDLNFLTRGFEFDIELLTRLQKKNFKIKEVFIPSKYLEGSTFNTNYVLPMFTGILKIWLNQKKFY